MSGKIVPSKLYITIITLLIMPLYLHLQEPIKAPKQENNIADIYLNFEDASLASVVNYLAEQKKINFIPHKDLAAKKVSLTTREPLTLERAWNVLLTLLEMNGFTIINVGDIYRIVPSKEHKQEPLPFYSVRQGVEPENLPDSDLVVRYIYILKNISTDVAKKILGDLLGAEKIQTNKDLGTCIITDKCYNIKSAMQIVKELDTGGLRDAIKIIRLRHTNAEEITRLFNEQIMEGQENENKKIRFIGPQQKKQMSFFSKTTKIIPELRQNALILLGLEQNIDQIIEFISKYLDVPLDDAESRIHIKELKYVEATKIKPIIDAMLKKPEGPDKSPLVGEFKFFEDVVIHAETSQVEEESRGSGNRLIISCNKDDWRRLEKLIDKLDKPQPQVALEIMIVDIDDTLNRELGTQIREKTGKSLLKGMTPFVTNLQAIQINPNKGGEEGFDTEYNPNLINVADGAQGTSVLTIGSSAKEDIWAVIKTFLVNSQTNIISQPFMITSNNEKCDLEINHTKRVPGKLDTEQRMLKYDDVNANTKLAITPRINVSGLVDLTITINLSEFLSTGSSDRPSRSNRTITTRTNVMTGEVLVLGGLTKRKVEEKNYKTPVLGNIPILGNLFKSKTKENTKTNLYVFIRPSIIKPKFEGGADEYTQLKLDYAKYQIMNVEGLRFSKDPIQRWFFKPEKQSIKQKISDLKSGIFRPIDNFSEGKKQPNSVRIQLDPYYRSKETIEEVSEKKEEEEKKRKRFLKQKIKPKADFLAKKKSKPIYTLPSLRKKKRS